MQTDTAPIRFGIVGSGFRAHFYHRVTRALPEHFQLCGIATTGEERAATLREKLGVPVYTSLEELVRQSPEFLVACKRRTAGQPEVLEPIFALGVPVLMETPAAWDLEGLRHIYKITRGRRVQVAEQFRYQPENAARLAVAASGLLGTVTQAEVAYLHTYHGMSMLRHFLNVGFRDAEIHAKEFAFPAVEGYMRSGIAPQERVLEEKRQLALLNFGDRLGIYDYEEKQMRSYVRSDHLRVRGERGELHGRTVRWLASHTDPRSYRYERQYAGEQSNLEGFFFRGILGGGEWLYRNPYVGARLSDDEIALATILDLMAAYVRQGKVFSSVAEACQDQYLSLMIDEAARTGQPLRTTRQIWAEEETP